MLYPSRWDSLSEIEVLNISQLVNVFFSIYLEADENVGEEVGVFVW
jgi:hypothetical protein